MSETETIRFSQLNDSNYAEWSIRMEAVLVRKNLWSVVHIAVDTDGKDESTIAAEIEGLKKKRSAQKMAEARAEMILRVDDGQLSHMRSPDPLEIWQTLFRIHRAIGFATSLALRRSFLTAKKAPTQSIQSWISEIQSLAFRMEEADVAVSPQDQILALTMGLPSSYSAVIINLDSMAPEILTLNYVITRLLNEEARQKSEALRLAAQSTDSEDQRDDRDDRDTVGEAMAATSSSRTPRYAASAAPELRCFFCDGKGHFKSDCPEKKKWEASKKKKGKEAAYAAIGLDSDDDTIYDAF